jgi:hypothetical protein
MEVHRHPHWPHDEKKKFKEYFFQFLMLFLAVTLALLPGKNELLKNWLKKIK